jgi:hypothetical protein
VKSRPQSHRAKSTPCAPGISGNQQIPHAAESSIRTRPSRSKAIDPGILLSLAMAAIIHPGELFDDGDPQQVAVGVRYTIMLLTAAGLHLGFYN